MYGGRDKGVAAMTEGNDRPEPATDEPRGDTEGPGNVSVDEPTDPALKDTDQDEFDKQGDEQEGS